MHPRAFLLVAPVAAIVVFMMLMAVNVFANGDGNGIIDSPHDFSLESWNTREEICRVCHVPHDHGRDTGDIGLLWNHALSSATYTMYAFDAHIRFIDGAAQTQPTGTAKMCLGCHDGTVGIDSFDKFPGGTVFIDDFNPDFQVPNHPTNANDLSNTHPISIAYDPAADSGLRQTTEPFGGSGTIGDVLEGNLVQCMSCHDVHDSTGESVPGTHLLRISQKASQGQASGLGLACHDK